MQPASPQEIEGAFRLLASDVAVITVDDGTGPHGCTANAWAEDPACPLLLTTLRRSSATRERIVRSHRFAANILAADQAELAVRFASAGDRFTGVSWSTGSLGQPVLAGVLTSLECELDRVVDFGTYDLLLGRVLAVAITQPNAALTHFAGSFGTHQPLGAH